LLDAFASDAFLDGSLSPALFAVALFLGMVLCLEIGVRIGDRRHPDDLQGTRVNAVEGAIFGLLGLMVAFTFSGASSRFDARRHLIAEEANAIESAWLRLDLLAPEAQSALQQQFRSYLDARIEIYRRLPDVKAAEAELARSMQLQGEIWTQAVPAARAASPQAVTLLLPALNRMIEVTTQRTMAARIHPPAIVFELIFVLALASALLAGHAMAGSRVRHWLHVLGFATLVAGSVYLILDIEYPRRGLIRIDAMDRVLVELRERMG
jgi:hypothetical protein